MRRLHLGATIMTVGDFEDGFEDKWVTLDTGGEVCITGLLNDFKKRQAAEAAAAAAAEAAAAAAAQAEAERVAAERAAEEAAAAAKAVRAPWSREHAGVLVASGCVIVWSVALACRCGCAAS